MMERKVETIRGFIERWLDEDHGEHDDMSMVQDMKLLLDALNETIEINQS